MDDPTLFHEQLDRIRLVINADTQEELAKFFGIDPQEIVDAERSGKIPAEWLMILLQAEYVSPEWVQTGRGACYTFDVTDHYEILDEEAAIQLADREALRRLPSGLLAKELARRIAVAEIRPNLTRS